MGPTGRTARRSRRGAAGPGAGARPRRRSRRTPGAAPTPARPPEAYRARAPAGPRQPVARPLDLGEPGAAHGEPGTAGAEARADGGLGRLVAERGLVGGVVAAAEGVLPRELGALERERADGGGEPERGLPLAGAGDDRALVDDGPAAGEDREPDGHLAEPLAPGVAGEEAVGPGLGRREVGVADEARGAGLAAVDGGLGDGRLLVRQAERAISSVVPRALDHDDGRLGAPGVRRAEGLGDERRRVLDVHRGRGGVRRGPS